MVYICKSPHISSAIVVKVQKLEGKEYFVANFRNNEFISQIEKKNKSICALYREKSI